MFGSLDVAVKYKEQQRRVLLLVVGEGPNLFGRNWLEKFQLDWRSICSLRTAAGMSIEIMLKKHETLFTDELGEIRGPPVHIHVPENTQPVFHRAHPVPYALKAKVEEELRRLETQGSQNRCECLIEQLPLFPS